MSIVPVRETDAVLRQHHYLGPTKAARFAWRDEFGVMVFAAPRTRNLPSAWLELVRWCLTGGKNAGSQQWARFVTHARAHLDVATVVSYSDPSQGHTGALYRACGWLWAPTWHRLRPPPTGNGAWIKGKPQAVKDRWVYPLAEDLSRAAVLPFRDAAIERRMPWARYVEPIWRRGVPDLRSGGGDYWRFTSTTQLAEAA